MLSHIFFHFHVRKVKELFSAVFIFSAIYDTIDITVALYGRYTEKRSHDAYVIIKTKV